MGCCGGDYCNFQFPPGPPLLEEPVAHLNARWLFLPLGTRLRQGELARIWMQNGKTRIVFVGEIMPVDYGVWPPRIVGEAPPTWAQVALDSDKNEDDLIRWRDHPLYDPSQPPCVVRFEHLAARELTLWERWRRFLHKVRSL